VLINRKSFLVGTAATVLLPAQEAFARTKPVFVLPSSHTKRFAWTIDDGSSNSAIKGYLNLAQETDQHLTFFVTSSYSSWRNNSSQIKDLLHQGKIQLGNHTFSHKNLVTASDRVVKDELQKCHDFMLNHFNYDARPYFRPTYGYWDKRVIDLAASVGYTVPVMWYGSIGDSGRTTDARMIELAIQWINSGRIVIDHANKMKAQHTLDQVMRVINVRELKSVTLREAFGKNFR
jgi:peptidoglycan/xylan/chitin deacetylase (PgdA/CDA1 family)